MRRGENHGHHHSALGAPYPGKKDGASSDLLLYSP